MAALRVKNVVIVDADCFVRYSWRNLVTRHPWVRFVHYMETVYDLLEWIPNCSQWDLPDLLFLSVDEYTCPVILQDVLKTLQRLLPDTLVICLENRVSPDQVEAAVLGGAAGFFVKAEIDQGLIPGSLRAARGKFVYTPGAHAFVLSIWEQARRRVGVFPRLKMQCLPAWRSAEVLSPRLQEVFELRFVHGHSSKDVGGQLGVKDDTINTYISRAFNDVIARTDGAHQDMALLEAGKLSRDQQAIVAYTALPNRPQYSRLEI